MYSLDANDSCFIEQKMSHLIRNRTKNNTSKGIFMYSIYNYEIQYM